ncbi:MAG: hypothetical protein ACLGGX_04355 [Bdellovibrionia bacterium]
MLINCPKCGFSQPQDKYCAQCGVDMESYQAQSSKQGPSFFKNPILQVILFIVVVGAGLTYLYRQDQSQLQNRVSFLQGNTQISSSATPESADFNTNSTPESFATETSDDKAEPQEASAESSLIEAMAEKNSELASKKAPESTNDKKESHQPASISGKKLLLTYAEISRTSLAKLFEEAQERGEYADFNDYVTGAIEDYNSKSSSYFLKVHHRETIPLKNNSATWFHGLKDFSEEGLRVGYSGYATATTVNDNNIRLNLEILRSWREMGASGGTFAQREYPLQAEIQPNTALFMTGLMPRNSNLEDQSQNLTSLPMFKILNSEEFQNRNSDFVLIIEIQN